MNYKKEDLILVIVLLGALFVSLSYSFYFRIPPAVDARAYNNIAWNIVTGNGYREDVNVPIDEDNAIMRVGPGYEFFLAAIYYLFGHHYEAVWVIQALLNVLSAGLIFLVTKEIFKVHWNYLIGVTAAILIGFSPDLITMQGMLMTETLGVFLIVLTAYLFFRYFNQTEKSGWKIFSIGVTLALASTVRTPALFLIFPIIWVLWKNKNWKHLLFVFLGLVLIFTPWIARNYYVYRTFVPTNLAYGIDLGSGNHFGASGELEPYPVNDLYLEQYGLVEGSRRLTGEALRFIVFNPLEFLKITLYRTSIYFSFARPTGFWFHLHGWSKAITLVFSAIYSVILFVFGFWGIWSLFAGSREARQISYMNGREKTLAKIFLAMLIMMPLAVVGIIVETRYRMLVYPFLAVFAGYGLSVFWQKKLEWQPALIITFLLGANTFFDVSRNLGRIFERIQDLTK
ncbi:MAG: hypothetical protein A3I89_01245 [Candidatus Harrisonbacteria bacterium RIFCSPLOWO2_02_FULL_41_11]|uniref:Glycosyltransferase RgtA/B/C/D-like domain-containing protein n=1 Tax=Candidatus Harrisonbacteria bacterium RIFCSPHIGHO2_02_FULL_42_16 TaxID=1798404 RepID=A0A1G1ZKC6_9BACT|nr:MAG: hypothetical protein A3B92_00735 [Candidatus Harrisonbacteria bacterium RIFCSPHIGHO2_02_FULL_42_16]OGY67596.1 MAG: hypothetical protein A3I89_01245 [Candidatus Harrisonbacteria bacterium RIFCSPLOWO2_02_FULL_41_11]